MDAWFRGFRAADFFIPCPVAPVSGRAGRGESRRFDELIFGIAFPVPPSPHPPDEIEVPSPRYGRVCQRRVSPLWFLAHPFDGVRHRRGFGNVNCQGASRLFREPPRWLGQRQQQQGKQGHVAPVRP